MNPPSNDPIASAIAQLDLTLHPDAHNEPFVLTESMRIPDQQPPLNDDERQQIIKQVQCQLEQALPQWIEAALEQTLSDRDQTTN